MNTKVALGIVLLVIIVVGGWYAYAHRKPMPAVQTTNTVQPMDTGTQVSSSPTNTGTGATGQKNVTITYTDTGFSPKSVSVPLGATVTWVNNSSQGMWVASNPHPTHTGYDGTAMSQHCQMGGPSSNSVFDECVSVPAGGSWSFVFGKTGTWGFHNHLSPNLTGSVTVTPVTTTTSTTVNLNANVQ